MKHIYRKAKKDEQCWNTPDGLQYVIKAVNVHDDEYSWHLDNGWVDSLDQLEKKPKGEVRNGNEN